VINYKFCRGALQVPCTYKLSSFGGWAIVLSSLGGGGTVVRVRLKVWERGRENGSFSVEEGNEVKDRVLETVGFQGANPICDGGGGHLQLAGVD
jgi:hypothetical protein